MKKVSVIVPAYNAEKYLEECLESICEQTYQALEILVVDDGSKDSTAAIIRNLAKQDARIKIMAYPTPEILGWITVPANM